MDEYIVNVLISTYNGELYIKDQIDSILNQTYPNIRIYVRDDGSKDGTVDILKKYCAREQIALIEGENVGYGRSFMELLASVSDGDYWAFCDQDDVWDSRKIEYAVEKIQTLPPDAPNMYFHNFSITDENLKNQDVYQNRIPGYSFPMAITECLHLGFATMINRKFRTMMLRAEIDRISTHDWWAELIVMEFGNLYTDDYIGAKHRRLDVSVSGNNLSTRIKWFFKAMKGNSEIHNITSMFLKVFGDEMKESDRKVLEWFVSDNYNFIKSLKKIFYKHRWRSSFSSELVVRFLMLIGRI